MALIECNECGQMISDKAMTCPKCGAPVEKRVTCDECGTEMLESMRTCPKCGCPNPLYHQNQSEIVEDVRLYETKPRKNILQKVLSSLSVILGISAICFAVFGFVVVNYDDDTTIEIEGLILLGGILISGVLLALTWKPRPVVNILSSLSMLILIISLLALVPSDYEAKTADLLFLLLMTFGMALPIVTLIIYRLSNQKKTSSDYQKNLIGEQPNPVNQSLSASQVVLVCFSTICGLSFLGYAIWIVRMLGKLSELSSSELAGGLTVTLLILLLDCTFIGVMMLMAWRPREIWLAVTLGALLLNLLLLLYGMIFIDYFSILMIGLSPLFLLIVVSLIVIGILLPTIRKAKR